MNGGKPLSPKAFHAKKKADWVENRAKLIELGLLSNDKTYISSREMIDAHTHVLNTGEKAVQALSEVSKVHGKGLAWVDDVKHSPVHRNVLNSSIKATQYHPVTLSMKGSGVLTRNSKRSFKESKTASSALNTVADMVGLQKRIESLEIGQEVLHEAVSILADQVDDNTERLDIMQKSVASPQNRAYSMFHNEGCTKKHIAEVLNKHPNTIARWLK